ncbi:hypothetical protein [Roseicyclus persicicus]|uniref:Uncharacterized protein n=1 Tax=Roseicyclus persicicus TaxID=2650661 RepID=A0A7X6GVX4_9RHOB|nr:hypothetical protein [Roseibacterium persicicum]NKX43351.1 hypothetical protein [Roseibacterium persicicum]
MTTKTDQRAPRPTGRGISGQTAPGLGRLRPDHAAQHGRATAHAAAARGPAPRRMPRSGASMDYQQGFFSGPAG